MYQNLNENPDRKEQKYQNQKKSEDVNIDSSIQKVRRGSNYSSNQEKLVILQII
jgi:hypothetical protein